MLKLSGVDEFSILESYMKSKNADIERGTTYVKFNFGWLATLCHFSIFLPINMDINYRDLNMQVELICRPPHGITARKAAKIVNVTPASAELQAIYSAVNDYDGLSFCHYFRSLL